MSFFARLKNIFGAKAEQTLQSLEDPRADLDYSLTRMQASYRQINDSLIEVSTARRSLEMQRSKVQKTIEKTDEQARQALQANREDLATRALERKAAAQEQLNRLNDSIALLDTQVESLGVSQANLRQKIELFQTRKEELKAVYDSSRAQLKVKEAATGVSKDLSDAAYAIQRAEARIQNMQSRVDAIDGLIAAGVIEDALSPGQDDIDLELAKLTRDAEIERELAQLKSSIAEGKYLESTTVEVIS